MTLGMRYADFDQCGEGCGSLLLWTAPPSSSTLIKSPRAAAGGGAATNGSAAAGAAVLAAGASEAAVVVSGKWTEKSAGGCHAGFGAGIATGLGAGVLAALVGCGFGARDRFGAFGRKSAARLSSLHSTISRLSAVVSTADAHSFRHFGASLAASSTMQTRIGCGLSSSSSTSTPGSGSLRDLTLCRSNLRGEGGRKGGVR